MRPCLPRCENEEGQCWCVTITRNCTGITSSRREVPSPITCMGARQQGQLVSSGTIVTSTCGRWAGSAPRLARRLSPRARACGCRVLLVVQQPRCRQRLARYLPGPEPAARDRASPNAGRTAHAATAAAGAAGDRFATAPGRARQPLRRARRAPVEAIEAIQLNRVVHRRGGRRCQQQDRWRHGVEICLSANPRSNGACESDGKSRQFNPAAIIRSAVKPVAVIVRPGFRFVAPRYDLPGAPQRSKSIRPGFDASALRSSGTR